MTNEITPSKLVSNPIKYDKKTEKSKNKPLLSHGGFGGLKATFWWLNFLALIGSTKTTLPWEGGIAVVF